MITIEISEFLFWIFIGIIAINCILSVSEIYYMRKIKQIREEIEAS